MKKGHKSQQGPMIFRGSRDDRLDGRRGGVKAGSEGLVGFLPSPQPERKCRWGAQ